VTVPGVSGTPASSCRGCFESASGENENPKLTVDLNSEDGELYDLVNDPHEMQTGLKTLSLSTFATSSSH